MRHNTITTATASTTTTEHEGRIENTKSRCNIGDGSYII